MQRKLYGIAVFHHIGDVLCCTPIAKQLKADDPTCHITYYTSTPGEVVLRHNPHIDDLVVLEGDQYALDDEIPRLMNAKPWTRFFTPAAYMNYEAIPGGSHAYPKGTIFGIVKAGARLNWTVPFTFPFVLTAAEQAEARAFWAKLPAGRRILVETDYRSEQSPWTDDYNFDMLDALADCDPVFIFTAKNRPVFLDAFLEKHPRAVWCDLPFRHNAELFNLCDAYVGVSSGISCLTYSEYCRTDVPRIEVTRGEHWGAAELIHHTELQLCYSRERYLEALRNLRLRLLDLPTEPDFTVRRKPELRKLDECPGCGAMVATEFRGYEIVRCEACQAIYSRGASTRVEPDAGCVTLMGSRIESMNTAEFFRREIAPASQSDVYLSGALGRVGNLREIVEKAAYVLKPGGAVHLAAPNVDGILANSMQDRWPQFDRRDAMLFSSRYLRELAIQCGLWIESWSTTSVGETRDLLRQALRSSRPDMSEDALNIFMAEIDKRGGGNHISVTARRRGAYQGRLRESTSRRATTPTQIVQVEEVRPAASVVIPCFNQAHHLTEAVESVIRQTVDSWEVLIVDDGSLDDTTTIAEALVRSYPGRRIRALRADHGGVAEARDVGISQALSEYIVALDADDRLSVDFLASALDAASEGAEVVVAPVVQFGVSERVWSYPELTTEKLLSGEALPFPPFFRKSVWTRMGGLNAGMPPGGEIFHFWLACVELDAKIATVEDCSIGWRLLREPQVHRAAQRTFRFLRALARTVHPALFSFEELCEEHRIIEERGDMLVPSLDDIIERFPGLPLPYLWRGLVREQKGLVQEALSDYDSCERRKADWQPHWRKLMLTVPEESRGAAEHRSVLQERFPSMHFGEQALPGGVGHSGRYVRGGEEA